MMRFGAVLVLLSCAVACSSTTIVNNGGDGGSETPDASGEADASASADASATGDASMTADAGPICAAIPHAADAGTPCPTGYAQVSNDFCRLECTNVNTQDNCPPGNTCVTFGGGKLKACGGGC